MAIKNLPIEERIKELRRFRWSTYRGYVDDECRLPWVKVGPVLTQMDERGSERSACCRRYVESDLAEADEDIRKEGVVGVLQMYWRRQIP